MSDLSPAAMKLKQACDRAYDANQASCSNAVWGVLKEISNKNEAYREANALVDFMAGYWRGVTLEEGYQLANQGTLVIGGTKKIGGHGHVIVVYPGEKKQNGGYSYWWQQGKKNLVMKATGWYPRAMSTSQGTWPGAMSRGDKTVWDPWGSDDAFDAVRFWTPKG
jgi:hypothetical protein